MPNFAVSSKLAVVIIAFFGVTGLVFIKFAQAVAKILSLNILANTPFNFFKENNQF